MDANKLKELAERADALHGVPSLDHSKAFAEFKNAANPQAILGLIQELEENEGVINVWRGRTQRAEAEVERLNEELSACTEHPGGCGYWREAAKHRAKERDVFAQELEAFKQANRNLSESNVRRRDENVRLKAENEALREKLSDCVISLKGEMLQKYYGQKPEDMHPVTRRDYDLDMAEIAEYQAALEGGAR